MENPIQLDYTKHDNHLIIGTNGVFVSCYYYQKPIRPRNPNWSGWQAFAGRKFELPLTDGTIEHCWGQWWSGGEERAEKILNTDIICVTANDIQTLKKCFVFVGYRGIKEKTKELRSAYTGKIYGYWEYDKFLKEIKK